MKILALGNSFSEDCTAYLERMTDDGVTVRNLYIGGCSLSRHNDNLCGKIADYELQRNGRMLGEAFVSANEVMSSEAWDVITVQEVSGNSGHYDDFSETLREVLERIRALCPTARQVWNQTWSYATYSTHGRFAEYGRDSERMFSEIEASSHRAADDNGLGLIEVGRGIQALRHSDLVDETEFCRDGFHLSLTEGRYAAAYVWARYFGFGVNGFVPEGADAERIRAIRAFIDGLDT